MCVSVCGVRVRAREGVYAHGELVTMPDRDFVCPCSESHNMEIFRKVRDAVIRDSSRGEGHSLLALFAAIQNGAEDKIRDMCQQDSSMVSCCSFVGSGRCVSG